MKQKYFLFVSLFALTLGSCQKDDETNDNNSQPVVNEPVAIQLSGMTIKEGSSEALETSRVANGKWETADMIGVFMLNDGTYNIAGENANKAYVTETGDGMFTPVTADGKDNTIFFPADGAYMDITAYYPYAELDGENRYVLNIADQSVQKKLDIMRGTPTGLAFNNASPKVDLTFRHKMAKINLTFVAGEGISDEELKNTVAELSGFYTKGYYCPIKDQFTVDGDKGSFRIWTAEDGKSAQGTIMPEKLSSGHSLSVTPGYYLEGAPYVFDISESQGFLSGRSYNYTVTFLRDKIIISSSSIEDWTEGEGGSGTITDDSGK